MFQTTNQSSIDRWIFPSKPSSYMGTPLTMENPKIGEITWKDVLNHLKNENIGGQFIDEN